MVFADEGDLIKRCGCSNDTIRQLRDDGWGDLLHCHRDRSVKSYVNQH